MTRYRYRSAITGEYVTPEYAARHPDTTVREKVGIVRRILEVIRAK